MIKTQTPALQKQFVLEATWTDCPEEVVDEIRQLWQDYEAGNDFYYISFEVEEMKKDYTIIAKYLKDNNVEQCLIHFWW